MNFKPSGPALRHLRGVRADWNVLTELLRRNIYVSSFDILRLATEHTADGVLQLEDFHDAVEALNGLNAYKYDPEPVLVGVTDQTERFVPPPPEVLDKMRAFLGTGLRPDTPRIPPAKPLSPREQRQRDREIQRLIKENANPSLIIKDPDPNPDPKPE